MILDGVISFLTVFALRLGDVPIGTLRTMLMIQGRRGAVFGLAVCESLIWLVAISRVLNASTLHDPWKVGGYAVGFATGVMVGMAAENWFAIGTLLVRIISRQQPETVRQKLLDSDFGVTAIDGRGRDGHVMVLFVVCPRRRLRTLLKMVEEIDPHALATHDAVTPALGGFHGWKRRPSAGPTPHK